MTFEPACSTQATFSVFLSILSISLRKRLSFHSDTFANHPNALLTVERGSITLKSCLEELVNICYSTQTEIYLFIHSFIHFYPFFFLRLFSQIGTVRWCPVQKKQNRQRGILKLLYSGSMAIFFHKAENDIKAFGRKLFSTRVFD